MQLTLALGLQYNSFQSRNEPILNSEGSSFALNKANVKRIPDVAPVNSVIDVKAISESTMAAQKVHQQADYLTYDLHAGLIATSNVGAKLNIRA